MSLPPCVSPTQPITYKNLCTSSKGEISSVVNLLHVNSDPCEPCTAVVRILKISEQDPSVKVFNCETIAFSTDNLYTLEFNAYPDGGCPMATFDLELVFQVKPNGFYLDAYEVSPGHVYARGLFPSGTTVQLITNPNKLKYFTNVTVKGVIGISSLDSVIKGVNAYDSQTRVLYVSSRGRPSVQSPPYLPPNNPALPNPEENPQLPYQYPNPNARYPWSVSIIPHKFDQPLTIGQNEGLPTDLYHDRFNKRNSVPMSIYSFFNNNPLINGIPSQCADDARNSVFLMNLENRGYEGDLSSENKWEKVNYLKKQYQSALTVDKLHLYLDKIDEFIGRVYSAVVTNRRPLVSTFREELTKFFLSMHVGVDDYPPIVVEYFNKFIDFIGAGNPDSAGRNLNIMFGKINTQKVQDYFTSRITEIIKTGDETTLTYWWHKASMPDVSVVFEAMHNIVAFSQFNNTMFGIVAAVLQPVINPELPSLKLPNFFSLYKQATTPQVRVAIAREVYRMLSPNSASFSNAQTTEFPNVRTQSRHIHQQIMIDNMLPAPVPIPDENIRRTISYFTLDPSANPNATEEEKKKSLYIYHNGGIAISYLDVNLDDDFLRGLNVIEKFQESVYVNVFDKETVSDSENAGGDSAKYQPVLEKPVYMPFGLGYRACAGQTFSLLMAIKILDAFKDVEWESIPSTSFPKVPVAPFKMVYDNIFAKPLVL